MTERFEVTHKDAFGRIGKFYTPHGVVETPALMPVINPNMGLVTPEEMRQFGASMLITNAYIIYRNPRLKELALLNGVHSLLGFDGPIMTDSGSFQLSTYGNIELSSREIVEFQRDIGSDIGTPLDIPTPPDAPYERARAELELTFERIQEAMQCCGDRMLIAAPVQGSTYLELRERYARILGQLGAAAYPIGAVVPLMESYRYSDLAKVVMASKSGLPLNVPVHLFGAGHPMMFALAVALGCDLFDSAAYALYARDGRYLTAHGTYKVNKLTYLPCSCPVCSTKNRTLTERELAQHNLWVSFTELNTIKQAILDGMLWELVERRCRHPALLQALRTVQKRSAAFELIEPRKSSYLYTSTESAARPEVGRYLKNLKNLSLMGRVLCTTDKHKTRQMEPQFDTILYMKPPFGPFPRELAETYPIGQSEVVDPDYNSIRAALKNLVELLVSSDVDATFAYDKRWEHEDLMKVSAHAKLVRIHNDDDKTV
ncbi:MAG: tRNA guanosine(15) transglycosylase TgtA [Halobacteriota archaeon]